ncbi:hypothetical protein M8J76_012307 [Diaphorina citri]|nr:hypothetical protein M8J76_012307 [Diaphorina citri]
MGLTAINFTGLFGVLLAGVVLSSFILSTDAYTYETKFFDAKLDHFTYVSNQTFPLKYLINDEFWDEEGGAPVFFYCGNEDAIETFAENLGFLWESAKRFSARVVLVEHRYYGSSLPFGPKSLSSPRLSGYLTVAQTLADFVDVIQSLEDASRLRIGAAFKPHPVIAFGGSYGGMLAFWLRLKYPHIVQGALASSAPMFQTNDLAPCDIYYKEVTKIYRDVSPKCEENIRNSWTFINTKLQTDSGRVEFSREWNLCSSLKTQVDVAIFKRYLSDMYTTMAMTNYPYPSNFLTPLPGNPVKTFCESFVSGLGDAPDGNATDILSALKHATDIFTQHEGRQDSPVCLDYQAASPIVIPAWHYQTCTELLFPFCATPDTMYEPYDWNLAAYSNACEELFGVRPDLSIIPKMFGDRRIEFTSNVIFSNGLKDPWSAGGVHRNLSDSIVAILIPDSAHHLDLRGSNPLDPPSVVTARHTYEEYFRTWIAQYRKDLEREATFV